ncbi:MAG: MarR family transcriptional regulator [Clostridia bacterium]|nr:MarR family transcriptional regulator [Clostridia bacterium]
MLENENLEQKTRVIFLMEKYAHYIFHRFFEKPGRDRALRILYDSGTITQKVFAEKMNIRPSSASDILAKMESEGLITRACHDDDKRNINITLTENGKKITEEVSLKQQAAVKQMMLSLTAEELTTLETLMNKLLSDWDCQFGEEAKLCGPHDRKRGKEK